MAAHPGTPRIAPLAPDQRDEQANELLDPLRIDGRDLNIFATLVRHPRLFKRWAGFGGFLLYRGELPARPRELLILRTAWLCGAEYEWGQHVRIGLTAGVSQEEVAAVIGGPEGGGWSVPDRALLQAADELHHDAVISDATWTVLAEHFDEHQLIEIPMVVGQYHLVAFTLNSLGVQREPGVTGFP
jgi:4-carboxymuconolactone decarboxylase